MKKNIIITVQAFIIIALICLFYFDKHRTSQAKTVRFPDVELGENERITQAMMQFQTASIKSVRNIPPGWYVTIDLNPPPNPSFKGNIYVGVAALGSTKELPEFELDRYVSDMEPKAVKVILTIEEYTRDGKERILEIDMEKP